MKWSPKADSTAPIIPAVHLEFIQNQAGLPDDAGIQEIENYHRALFLHHHAVEMERYRQEAQACEQRLGHLESRLKETHNRLGATEHLVPVDVDGRPDTRPTLPWNLWDRAMLALAGAGIAMLLVFGVLNVSFNLLESGLVTFVDNPARAYFWAALLPVGALAVKVGWDFLESRKLRDLYLWTCLFVGIAGVIAWVGAYATVYPSLSKSSIEQLASLSVFSPTPAGPGATNATTASGVKWVDALIVAAQATAEIFLSAVLGMAMTTLYARHRPVRLAGNPLFVQWDTERSLLEGSVLRERQSLANAQGHLRQLENQLTALLSYARSMFRKQVEVHRDESRARRAQLEQVWEHLSHHFNPPESTGNGTARDTTAPTAAPPNRQLGH